MGFDEVNKKIILAPKSRPLLRDNWKKPKWVPKVKLPKVVGDAGSWAANKARDEAQRRYGSWGKSNLIHRSMGDTREWTGKAAGDAREWTGKAVGGAGQHLPKE